MIARSWPLHEAEAQFSELVERAMAGEAQVVRYRGREAVVLIAYEEYERLHGKAGSAWDLFKTAPRIEEDDLPLYTLNPWDEAGR